ncbi:MAG: STAS/SEC14 domain-containing protein [Bacteroidota bacterium]|nr:STAS/SEC14 domain-containing protein [Bacteroidota bacterium]
MVLTLDLAKNIVESRLKISDGITRPILIDIRNLVSVDKAAREYLASHEATFLLSAGAISFGSTFKNYMAILAGNVFIKIDKPAIPTKLFTEKDKALQWLRTYATDNKFIDEEKSQENKLFLNKI